MSGDLLEQLSASRVPPVSGDFESQVHRRVNERLIVSHLIDFVCRAIPYCFGEFARALAATARGTASGGPATGRRDKSP